MSSTTNSIQPSAMIAESATLGDLVRVDSSSIIRSGAILGDHVYIGPGAVIGNHVSIYMHTRIGANSRIGRSTTIDEYVSIKSNVRTGRLCNIGKGAIIGSGVILSDLTFVPPYANLRKYGTLCMPGVGPDGITVLGYIQDGDIRASVPGFGCGPVDWVINHYTRVGPRTRDRVIPACLQAIKAWGKTIL